MARAEGGFEGPEHIFVAGGGEQDKARRVGEMGDATGVQFIREPFGADPENWAFGFLGKPHGKAAAARAADFVKAGKPQRDVRGEGELGSRAI